LNADTRDVAQAYSVPVAIGGIGGSGTRLVTKILMDLGVYMGDDLNGANDNLWFTLLFKRPEILSLPDHEFEEIYRIFSHAMAGARDFTASEAESVRCLAAADRDQHNAVWLKQRARSLLVDQTDSVQHDAWGWKEPNTHVVLDRLIRIEPEIRYIHVARNGLDMAFGANQNQLALWGNHFLGASAPVTPRTALKFWCAVHRRIIRIGRAMGSRFLFLNYDDLCQRPDAGLEKILKFMTIPVSEAKICQLAQAINPPESIGRFRQRGLSHFDEEDVAFVESLGFERG